MSTCSTLHPANGAPPRSVAAPLAVHPLPFEADVPAWVASLARCRPCGHTTTFLATPVPVGTDRLGQLRYRVPGRAFSPTALPDPRCPARGSADRIIGACGAAARLADRGLRAGVMHAVPAGPPCLPPADVRELVRQCPMAWIETERATLTAAAGLALAYGRWPEACELVCLLDRSGTTPTPGLRGVRDAVSAQRRAAADVAHQIMTVMFRADPSAKDLS